jgi:S-DNA-T family DNA segregation ATPase FtsK/SpoIIIE
MIPILPLHLSNLIQQILRDALCLISFFIGGLSIIGIAFHFPLYPSFNTVNDVIQSTKFGFARSVLADILIQLYGYSGIFFGIFFLAVGTQILSSSLLRIRFIRRFFLLQFSFLFLGCSIASLWKFLPIFHRSFFGSLGLLLSQKLHHYLELVLSSIHYLKFIDSIFITCNIFFLFFGVACLKKSLNFSLTRFVGRVGEISKKVIHSSFFFYKKKSSSSEKVMDFEDEEHKITSSSKEYFKKNHDSLISNHHGYINNDTIDEFDYYPTPPTVKAPTDLKTIAESAKAKPSKRNKNNQHDQSINLALLNKKNDGSYVLPPIDLLNDSQKPKKLASFSAESLEQRSEILQKVLEEFSIKGKIINARPGPVVTLFEFKPAPGIKTARVISLSDDIARSMSALSTRIAIISGQNLIGIELPNEHRHTVFLKDLLKTKEYSEGSFALPLILGQDIGGQPIIVDLARMPHLLVAGTTGSGKSVSINVMILSLLFALSPEQCKFIMIDPKMLELSVYDDIPHLLTPVVTDPKKAISALKWAVKEMERRYQAMSKLGVRNIDNYNERITQSLEKGSLLMRRVQTGFDPDTGKPIFENQPLDFKPLPYIVVIVDEMADLMLVAGKEIEGAVQRLAQMARAAGIHLIMATQRPSVDVITGTIKANFPTRISFQVTSKIDSRTILGEQGAEQLLGQGDMLYMAGGGRTKRVHGPFVNDLEVEKVVSFLKNQAEPSYSDTITQEEIDMAGQSDGRSDEEGEDNLYKKALELIQREKKVSTSFVQRHLKIGYNRAANIVEQMEKAGVVSAPNHSGKRTILIDL